MSGPPYPADDAISGGIGSFVIGITPIGGKSAPFKYRQTIISQYANSDILTYLIWSFYMSEDQTPNMDAFFDSIWNVDTATGVGLDIWGRIVGVSRTLQVSGDRDYFGFNEATDLSAKPYNVAPFYVGDKLSTNFDLPDDAYRTLILAKAFANVSDGSIPSINKILRSLFPGRGNCYCTDGQDMTMTYTFEFILQPVELAILSQTGVLPKPSGVSATIVQVV